METENIMNAGLQGFQKAQTEIYQSAERIANVDNPKSNTNLTEELINMKEQENVAKANAKVIQTGSDLVGSIINLEV